MFIRDINFFCWYPTYPICIYPNELHFCIFGYAKWLYTFAITNTEYDENNGQNSLAAMWKGAKGIHTYLVSDRISWYFEGIQNYLRKNRFSVCGFFFWWFVGFVYKLAHMKSSEKMWSNFSTTSLCT